jgi:hypothetical protein
MADRLDFYYREKVLEGDLDGAFDGLEEADHNLAVDVDFAARVPPSPPPAGAKSEFGGICWGFDVTHLGSTTSFQIGQGAAYDELGKRIGTDGTLTVDFTHDGDLTIGEGGHGDGVSVLPTVSQYRWLTLFIVYDRKLSDLRYDGYNNAVYHVRDESFHFEIVMSTSSATPTKPDRELYKLLLLDVKVYNNAGALEYADHDVDRTEWFYNRTSPGGAPDTTISQRGKVRDVLADLQDLYNEHVGGRADKHPSGAIEFTPSQTWWGGVGGNFGAAIDVGTALNGIVLDLATQRSAGSPDPAGSNLVGIKDRLGVLATPASASPVNIEGSIQVALEALQDAVNGRVFRGGDDGIAGDLAPALAGHDLGASGKEWDIFVRDLTFGSGGAVKSDVLPDGDGTRDLGSGSLRWNGYFNSIGVYGSLNVTATGGINCDGLAYFNDTTLVSATLQISPAGDLDCNGPADFAEDSAFQKYLGTKQIGIIPATTHAYGLDIDGKNLNLLAGGTITKLQKMEGRRTVAAGSSVALFARDVFGFEERGFSNYFCGVIPHDSPAIADIADSMAPWWAEATGSGTVAQIAGYGNLAGPGFRVPALGDKVELWFGPSPAASSLSPFAGALKPGVHFAIYSSTESSRTFAYGAVRVGIQTNSAEPSRMIYLDFNGTGGYIRATYYDGSTFQTSSFSGSAPLDNVLYSGRIVYLDASNFLFSLYGDGILINEVIFTATGSPYTTSYGAHPFLTVENGSASGGTTIVLHRLQVSTIALSEFLA